MINLANKMVGKRDNKTEEVDEEYFKFLKQNNKSLAKALTNERLKNKASLEERSVLQRKLQSSSLLNMRYKNIMNQLLSQCKHTLPTCVSFSDSIVQMMKLSSDGVNLSQNMDAHDSSSLSASQRSSSPYVVNKTHAVKPMVSGHVIARPTISLWRLSDREHAELTRNLESQSVDLQEISPPENQTENAESESYNSTTSQNRINFSSRRQPIRVLPDIYVDDEEQDEDDTSSPESQNLLVNENGDIESPQTSPVLNGRPCNLSPVLEVSEDSSTESEDNTVFQLREARIVLDALPDFVTKKFKNEKKSTRVAEDPLEGPSTLLDDYGRVTVSRYVSKSRASRNSYLDAYKDRLSDSDSSTEDKSPINRPEIIPKRCKGKRKNQEFKSESISSKAKPVSEMNKIPAKKKMKAHVHAKTENNHIDPQHAQPIVVLTPLNDMYQPTNKYSTPTSSNNTSSPENYRSQRISNRIRKNYNFKEVSLKW